MLGQGASYEFRWRRWALLRDAVVAHLEGGTSGSRFPQFAAIGNALGVASVRLPGAALAAELEAIRSGFAAHTLDDLVMGVSTASVLYPNVQLEAARPLSNAERHHIAPPGESRTLDQYFSAMLESMLQVAEHPDRDGTIEVLDG